MKKVFPGVLLGALVLALCVAPVVAVSADSPNEDGFKIGRAHV